MNIMNFFVSLIKEKLIFPVARYNDSSILSII